MRMTFKEEFTSKIDIIDEYLHKYLTGRSDTPKEISEAMRYSIFAGGKRIRPVIMLSVCEMLGGEKEDVIPYACALEMIHTYSLIHDDLPAMDNSPLRRGKKTNHIVFGEAMAILAGDGLLNYAFELILSSPCDDTVKALKASAYMAECSGVGGMIGGQVIDILSENRSISSDTLRVLQEKKTSALIRAAAVCGAIIAGSDSSQIKTLEDYAVNLGLAFQIKDDILDVEGESSKLGKPVGGDLEAHKNTYVSIYGIDRAKELLLEHTNKAKDAIASFGTKSEFLLSLTDYLLKRSN